MIPSLERGQNIPQRRQEPDSIRLDVPCGEDCQQDQIGESSTLFVLAEWRSCHFLLVKRKMKIELGEMLGWRQSGIKKFDFLATRWCQDNRNRSNQESKFDFLATRQQLGKIDRGQQKIKIVRTNRQSNLQGWCQQREIN